MLTQKTWQPAKSALLSSNNSPCPQYYNTSSAIRAKTHFLGPEGLKSSWICLPKRVNKQILLLKLPWKPHFQKFCKSKMYRNCTKKIASVGSSVWATTQFLGWKTSGKLDALGLVWHYRCGKNSQALQKSVFTAHPLAGSWISLKSQSIKNRLRNPNSGTILHNLGDTTRQRPCATFSKWEENQRCD